MATDVKCEINGRVYTFKNVINDGGVPYGYCPKLKKHGWVHEKFIFLEDGTAQKCTRIEA